MLKKPLVMALAAVFTLVGLTGCGTHDAASSYYGDLAETAEQKEDPVKIERTKYDLYAPKENIYGYTLKPYEVLKSRMVLHLPSSYKVEAISDRHLVLRTPEDDPKFKSMSISVFFRWFGGSAASDNDKAEYRSISELDGLFEDDLYTEDFKINGKTAEQYAKTIPHITVGADYAKKGYENTVCTSVHEGKIYLEDDMPDGYKRVDVYGMWYGNYIALSAFCKEANEDKTKELLHFILSNATYKEDNIKEITYSEPVGGFKAAMPSCFREHGPASFDGLEEGCTYTVPTNSGTAFSGQGIGLFLMDNKKANALLTDEDYMDEGWRNITRSLYEGSGKFRNVYYCEKQGVVNAAGRNAERYKVTEAIVPYAGEYDKFYSMGETYYIDALKIDTGGKTLIIAYRHGMCDSVMAERVLNVILRDSK